VSNKGVYINCVNRGGGESSKVDIQFNFNCISCLPICQQLIFRAQYANEMQVTVHTSTELIANVDKFKTHFLNCI
jgi:hypothetical protein